MSPDMLRPRPVKVQDGQGSKTIYSSALKTPTIERDRLLLTKLTEMSRNLRDLPPEEALDKLAGEVSLMTSAEVNGWYHLLAASRNAGALVRGAAERAAEQYRMNQQSVPAHVVDVLRVTLHQPFDDAYMRRLQDGDPPVMSHFFTHFSRLLRVKLARRNPEPSIHDIVQETLCIALAAIREGKIPDPQRLGAFVNAICNNLLREYSQTQTTIQPEADPAGPCGDQSDLQKEVRARVRRVMGMLPPRDREILQTVLQDKHGQDEPRQGQYLVDREYIHKLIHRAISLYRNLNG